MAKAVHFDGLKFIKDDNAGYYLCSRVINGERPRLHRYVWSYYNGEIPKGYHIHHIDMNKSNNDISNLTLISASDHASLHAQDEDVKKRMREHFLKNVIPKAAEWHGSEEGRKWHSEHAANIQRNMSEEEKECEVCGSRYSVKIAYLKKSRFCSNKCKSAYRRQAGFDDEKRKCLVCGIEFNVNKYAKTQTCTKKCGAVWRESRRRVE